MITAGIDASTKSTGWSIFDGTSLVAYGCIKPDGDDWRDRIFNQGSELNKIINTYHPDQIIMEDVPLTKGTLKTLVILGAVQGFIYGVAASHGIPVQFVNPSQWRSPMGLFDGSREGTKRLEMKKKSIEKANELFGLSLRWVSPSSKFNDDDIADSILVAYSQIKPRQFGKPKSR